MMTRVGEAMLFGRGFVEFYSARRCFFVIFLSFDGLEQSDGDYNGLGYVEKQWSVKGMATPIWMMAMAMAMKQ